LSEVGDWQAHQLKELSSAICVSDSARKKKISLEKKEKDFGIQIKVDGKLVHEWKRRT